MMKTSTTILLLTCLAALIPVWSHGQSMSINSSGAVPESSAMLDITSTSKGMLIPRMTKSQRDNIDRPATSLMIYQTDNTPGYYLFNGTIWSRFLDLANGVDDNDWDTTATALHTTKMVGIGTSAPNYELQIHEPAGTLSYLQFTESSQGTAADDGLRIGLNNGVAEISQQENNPLTFSTNSTEWMRLTNVGRLGIGETSPDVKLHVTSIDNTADIRLDDSFPFLFLNATSGNGGIQFEDDGTDRVDLYYNTSTSKLILDIASLGTDMLTFTNSGYMGILQSNPTVPLQIDGGTDAALTDGTGYLMLNDESSTNLVIDDNEIIARNNGAESTLHLQTEGGPLQLHSGQGGTTVVTIEDDGDMAIGTATASDRIHIYESNPRFRAESSTTGFAGLVSKNTQREYFMGVQGAGDPVSGEFHIYDNTAGAQRLVVDASGFLGLGESNPQARLDVLDNAVIGNVSIGSESSFQAASSVHAGDGFLVTPWLYTNAIEAQGERGTGSVAITVGADGNFGATDEINFITAGERRMQIRSNGEVGIGTENTNAMLTIEDDDGDLNSGIQLATSTSQDWYMYQNTDFDLVFRDDGSDRLTIDNAGLVGIGITGPSHILHINGQGRSTSAVWATSSDERAKENIQSIDGAMDLIAQLRPVTFNWSLAYQQDRAGLKELNYGFISQEVEQVIPAMVMETTEVIGNDTISDFKLLDKDPLIALLVQATKEQQIEIDSLQQTNEYLQHELQAIRALLDRLLQEQGIETELVNAQASQTTSGKQSNTLPVNGVAGSR